MKERLIKTAQSLSPLIVLIPLVTLAYTARQRKYILNRDNNHCQFPVDRGDNIKKCGSRYSLEVHHIYPQRQAEHDGLDQDREVDVSENGITLCKHHHQEVHPDMRETFSDYRRQKVLGIKKPDSFKRLFKKREEKVKQGEKYWDDSYDEYFLHIAKHNENESVQVFPEKKRRTTKNRKGRKFYDEYFGG